MNIKPGDEVRFYYGASLVCGVVVVAHAAAVTVTVKITWIADGFPGAHPWEGEETDGPVVDVDTELWRAVGA